MRGTRWRSSVVLLALGACAGSGTVRGTGAIPEVAQQPSVTTDVVYGHNGGLALTLDVHRPAQRTTRTNDVDSEVVALMTGTMMSVRDRPDLID